MSIREKARYQHIILTQISYSESVSLSACILPPISVLPRHRQDTLHGISALAHEHDRRQWLTLHLQDIDLTTLGFEDLVISTGCSLPLSSFLPKSVKGGKTGSQRWACLYRDIWYTTRSRCWKKASFVGGSVRKSDFEVANMCCRSRSRLEKVG